MGMAMLMNPHVSAQLLAYQCVPSFIYLSMWSVLVNRMPIAEKWSVPRGRVKLLLNSVCVAIRMVAKGVVIEGDPTPVRAAQRVARSYLHSAQA